MTLMVALVVTMVCGDDFEDSVGGDDYFDDCY